MDNRGVSLKDSAEHPGQLITPSDMLSGLAAAERGMLATFLALFDDGKLQSRLKHLISKGVDSTGVLADEYRNKLTSSDSTQVKSSSTEMAKEIESNRDFWFNSKHPDEMLRLILWTRIREAFHLPARLSITTRGNRQLADDVAAALINAIDPPNMLKSSKRWLYRQGWLDQNTPAITLSDVVVPVLDELLANSLSGEKLLSQQERRAQLNQILAGFSKYGVNSYAELLNTTGANRSNDNTILITTLLGGGLGAFGSGVSLVGFSAYIAAAQASAFIPMVSGPGLVSFVSVVSNPVAILGVVGGSAWLLARSAQEKANIAIASRVISLLCLCGLQTEKERINEISDSFAMALHLDASFGLKAKVVEAYKHEWSFLEPLWQRKDPVPDANVIMQMTTPIKNFQKIETELYNTFALGVMTLGDILYNYAAINSTVINAADFSLIVDIDGRVDFSELARGILDGSKSFIVGATANLKGYTAEMAVADQLIKSGHTVSFPDNANEPGWDLLVDGEEFQIKFHDSLQGLKQHFERYDYPVIANTELMGNIPEEYSDKVFFIDGLSNALVTQITEESLIAGANVLAESPLHFATTISIANGLLGYYRGRLTAKQTVEQVLLDGTVRMGLFGAGGMLGASVGFMIFGPAGAWVFGSSAPILLQTQTNSVTGLIRRKIKGKAYIQWEEEMHFHLALLQKTVLNALENKIKQMSVKLFSSPQNELEKYLNWRLGDDVLFIRETMFRIAKIQRNEPSSPEHRVLEMLKSLANCGVHPHIYQSQLRDIETCIKSKPSLFSVFEDAGQVTHGLMGHAKGFWRKQ